MSLIKHGGDLRSFAEKCGKKESEILDFSSNINPWGLPPLAEEIFPQLLAEVTRYPDPQCEELCQEIVRHFPLWPENVIAGNGSISLIELAIRVIKPRTALLVEPCFTEYRRLLNLAGTQVRSVLLRESEAFQFQTPEILNAMRGVEMVILGHPNNPTGSAMPRAELIALLEEARRRNIFVLVDEAFCDWTPELSIAREIKDNVYFAVSRSLTKFYALAGVRSGFMLGARKFIARLRNLQETWACNRLAQRLSIAALRDDAYRTRSLAWFKEESAWMFQELNKFPEIEVFPSLANFFLVKIKGSEWQLTFSAFLEKQGFYLRPLADFSGLSDPYFRISLRLREDHEALLKVMRETFRPHETFVAARPG